MRWYREILCAICPRRFVAQRDAQQVCPACKARKLVEMQIAIATRQMEVLEGPSSLGAHPG